jgi:hypothetical protein
MQRLFQRELETKENKVLNQWLLNDLKYIEISRLPKCLQNIKVKEDDFVMLTMNADAWGNLYHFKIFESHHYISLGFENDKQSSKLIYSDFNIY